MRMHHSLPFQERAFFWGFKPYTVLNCSICDLLQLPTPALPPISPLIKAACGQGGDWGFWGAHLYLRVGNTEAGKCILLMAAQKNLTRFIKFSFYSEFALLNWSK